MFANTKSNVLCVLWAIALSAEQEMLLALRAEKFEYCILYSNGQGLN